MTNPTGPGASYPPPNNPAGQAQYPQPGQQPYAQPYSQPGQPGQPGQAPPYSPPTGAPVPAGNQGRSLNPRGWMMIAGGGGLIVLGIIITIITYSMASGGGTFIVAWGLPLFGVVLIIRGIITLFKR